jgi:hypothetical protein
MNRKTIKHLVTAAMVLTTMSLASALVVVVDAHDGDPVATPTAEPIDDVTLDYIPSYYEHIQPIMQANCVGCHVEGEIGHDIFEMDTAEEIIAGAEDIGLVASTGYMPPWPPSELSPHFLYERTLTDEQIVQIMAWVEAGAPAGDAANAVTSEVIQTAPSIEADVVLQMPEPYTPNRERADDYRCFLLDPGFTENTYITGYTVIPDNAAVVHHTILFPAAAAQRSEAERLNGADGKPGWECFGGSGLSAGGPDMAQLRVLLPLIQHVGGMGEMRMLLQSDDAVARLDEAIAAIDTDGSLRTRVDAVGGTEALANLLRQGLLGNDANPNQPASGIIGSWVPGNIPTQFPDNTGLLIPAGGFIVMQMHYNTSANPEPDQSQLILDTAVGDDMAALRILDINGPVEIPCPDGVTGEQCTREYAIAQSGDGSDTVLAICGQYLEQYQDQDPTNAQSYCDTTVPVSGWALSILSHQHKLGKSTRTILHPDTPEEQLLIDIPVWDFDWQGDYRFAEPIWLNAGDKIRLICTYDNSVSRSNPEPHYVVAGESTSDEMCLNFITILPAEPGTPAPVVDTHAADHE